MAQLKWLLLMAQSSSFLITRRFCWELRVWLHPGQWESRSWALSLRLVGAAGRADLWGDGMATSKQKGDLPPELFPPPSFWGCCSVNTDDNTEAKPVVSSVSLQLSLLSPRRTRGHITVPCREQDRRTGHITSLRFKALCLYLSAAVAFCLESCSGVVKHSVTYVSHVWPGASSIARCFRLSVGCHPWGHLPKLWCRRLVLEVFLLYFKFRVFPGKN